MTVSQLLQNCSLEALPREAALLPVDAMQFVVFVIPAGVANTCVV